jgi:RNA polymerase-interacting CarD/CdnL/TRCF family regulator
MTIPFAEWLKSAKERCERATPGPWYPCGARYTMISRDLNNNEIEDVAEVCNHFGDDVQIEHNKQLIAHARQDLPRALQILEESIEVIKAVADGSIVESQLYGIRQAARDFLARLERE